MMRIWLWPLVVAVASIIGLVAGLISEGAGDWLSWLALTEPVVIGVHGPCRYRGRPRSRPLTSAEPRQAGRS